MWSAIHGLVDSKFYKPPAPPADSISLNYEYLEFDWDGTPLTSATVVITANGSWTSTQIDTGYGTFGSCNPTSYGGSAEVNIYCTENSGAARDCRIQFTRGSAVVNLDIHQYSM